VLIKRETPRDGMDKDFSAQPRLKGEDLDEALLQAYYIGLEALDNASHDVLQAYVDDAAAAQVAAELAETNAEAARDLAIGAKDAAILAQGAAEAAADLAASYAGSAGAGTYMEVPTAPSTDANEVKMYAKDVTGVAELFIRKESNGAEIQVTSGGILNGTPPDASEGTKGIAELATQAETNAGTDDARIVTPKKLLAAPMVYRKNVIINGCARVAQRGGSHNLTTAYAYGAVDRWRVAVNSATGFTSGVTSQGASTSYESGNFINFGSLNFTQANAVLCATRIEAKDAAFLYGKTISIQFKVWHNLGSTVNANGVILSANSVDNHATQTTQHIQSDVSCADNTVTTVKWEGLAINSACAINGFELAIVVDVVSCTNKSVAIGDVQLEIGNVCTPFEFHPYQQELALCQRYFVVFGASNDGQDIIGSGVSEGSSTAMALVNHPVEMRALPSLSYSSANHFAFRVASGGNNTATNITLSSTSGTRNSWLSLTLATNPADGYGGIVRSQTSGGRLYLSAEL